jgi:TonB family protein
LPANVKALLPGRTAVKVRVQVDATGKVTSSEPLNITGSLGRFLGAAATSALRTWQFEPAKMAGRNVAGELTVEFIFVP